MRKTIITRFKRPIFVMFYLALAVTAVPAVGRAVPQAPPDAHYSTTQATVKYRAGVRGLFDVTYASLPGFRPLKLDIYLKSRSDPKLRPVIFFVHGGGFQVGSNRAVEKPWGDMDFVMAKLAARGFIVVAPTYRLSSEAKFPAQVEDIKTAIRWFRANAARYGADPERVGVWGTSVGGSVAALLGTSCGISSLEGAKEGFSEQSSCVNAVADWFGATDLTLLDVHAPPGGLVHNSPTSSQTAVLGCIPNICPKEIVQLANPIAYVDPGDRRTKFWIAHGDADTAVGWRQSKILQDALAAQGVASELTIVPGAGHYWEHATVVQTRQLLDHLFAFFEDTLKP